MILCYCIIYKINLNSKKYKFKPNKASPMGLWGSLVSFPLRDMARRSAARLLKSGRPGPAFLQMQKAWGKTRAVTS